MPTRPLVSCLLALASLHLCLPITAKDGEQVLLRFVSFPKSADPKPVELLMGEGQTILVDLPTNSISPAYKVMMSSRWSLGKTITDADGKSAFQVYGSTPALPSTQQLILVVRKGKSDADGFDLIAFDDRTSKFAGGTYIFFNGAKIDVACSLGETKFALKPLQHSLQAPQPSEIKGERKYLYTHMYFRKGEEAEPFYSSKWRFSDQARSMVFLYHDTHNERLRVHTIRDYLP